MATTPTLLSSEDGGRSKNQKTTQNSRQGKKGMEVIGMHDQPDLLFLLSPKELQQMKSSSSFPEQGNNEKHGSARTSRSLLAMRTRLVRVGSPVRTRPQKPAMLPSPLVSEQSNSAPVIATPQPIKKTKGKTMTPAAPSFSRRKQQQNRAGIKLRMRKGSYRLQDSFGDMHLDGMTGSLDTAIFGTKRPAPLQLRLDQEQQEQQEQQRQRQKTERRDEISTFVNTVQQHNARSITPPASPTVFCQKTTLLSPPCLRDEEDDNDTEDMMGMNNAEPAIYVPESLLLPLLD